jgi:peroxiredoxin
MVNLDRPELIMNPVFYNNLWRNFQQIQLLAGTETENEMETAQYRMNFLDNNTALDSEIRSILYFTTFNQLLNFYRGAELPTAMEKFYANCKDSTDIAKIAKRFDEVKHLMAGQMAPDFTLPDIDGKMISLSQFRGKVVAVDLWATWCKPCIDAFPEWEALQQEFTNDEVTFLTISIDEKKDQWSNFVHDNNKKGYQLFAENAGMISFKQAYFVRRIPRYMLIDQTGKIIDTDRSKLTKEDIEGLLAAQ